MGRVPDAESLAKMEGLIDSNDSNEMELPYFSDTGAKVKEISLERDNFVNKLRGRFTKKSLAEIK
jgi:hypothetical protein